MTLIDANLLLYAYAGSTTPHHQAKRWLEDVFSRPDPVGLAWVTILAFLRISTDPRLRGRPLLMSEAVAIVHEWLELPNISLLGPSERHWQILQRLLAESQVRGPLVTDAHLAALAIEHGATLCTTDRDFTRFAGLRVLYPLQAR